MVTTSQVAAAMEVIGNIEADVQRVIQDQVDAGYPRELAVPALMTALCQTIKDTNPNIRFDIVVAALRISWEATV